MEAIKPEELISYLDSPECKSDNNRWMTREEDKTSQHDINWYKGLVSGLKK